MTTGQASTQAVQPATPDTLLVIGAGEGHDIPPDWREYYQRLVLVEPLPELARSLRLAFGEDPNVEVLEAAIVPGVSAGDTVTLYELNWVRASSRHQPADLLHLFPGLKTERMLRVSALSPEQLIRELDLSADGEHALVLEAPADEGPIISALIEIDAHKSFARLQVRYPASGLYDTPEDPEAMLQALKDCGFEIDAQDRTDPDWPAATLIRNRWKVALEEARKEIRELESQLKQRQQALDQYAQRADQLAASIKEEVEARHTLEARLSKFTADEGFYTRRHTLLQIDLDNLRERFAESERQRAQQEALLRKLTPRLAQAAQELKKLRIMPAPITTALSETETEPAPLPALPETNEPSKKKRKRKLKS